MLTSTETMQFKIHCEHIALHNSFHKRYTCMYAAQNTGQFVQETY